MSARSPKRYEQLVQLFTFLMFSMYSFSLSGLDLNAQLQLHRLHRFMDLNSQLSSEQKRVRANTSSSFDAAIWASWSGSSSASPPLGGFITRTSSLPITGIHVQKIKTPNTLHGCCTGTSLL